MTALELGGYAGAWPAGLDPATNTNGAADQDQMNAIFGQLFQLAEGGKLVADLATSATPKNSGKTWVISLRPGLKFSDGTPMDAQAVLFNWKRDLATPCTCKPILPPVTSLTAPNPTTVELSMAAPNGAFQNQLLVANLNWIGSPTALKKMGEQAFKLKPVGAGPFTVVSDTLSNTLVLKKNPTYWESGKPYLDNLTFKATADDEAALEALQSGAAQAYDGMATPSLVSTYKSHFTTTEQPATSPYNIQLNTAAPPFNNLNARLAIYYATDASIIDQKLFGNQFQVVQGFTAPGGLFYYPNVPGYPTYDLNKAKQLVKQVGGLNVNFFTLASPVNQNFMEALQTLWKQAGINTSIHLYSLAGLIQQFDTKTWQAALQTAGAWDPAAGVGLGFRFLSQSPFSGVHDKKLDALILGGQGAVDPSARDKVYQQAAQYIAKSAYSPFLFPLASWNVAVHGVVGPGLTTVIPSVVVNTPPLWQDVGFTK
ncbi:MAG: ABC transporter substrate-binding protein [Solirubrobacterales bacterium]|nr:ABC transporter substrate-binding protein [Solirubrobacterales bacterium]MBV9942471.1 ABC transporter substrate-binding protein [Solirubrobacterales bacterium]